MPKQLLTDLLNEMKSKCISDVFDVEGHKYEMQLLNGEEAQWRNDHIPLNGISLSEGKASVSLGIVNAIKRPTLAIALKKIDGESVESLFEEEWEKLGEDTIKSLLAESKNARKWFVAEEVLKFTGVLPGDVIEELWKNFDKLNNRRIAVQEEVKKSSGESEKTKDSTPLSPSGDK